MPASRRTNSPTNSRRRVVLARLLAAVLWVTSLASGAPLSAEAIPQDAHSPPPKQTGVTGFCASVAQTGRRIRLHCQNSTAGKLLANMVRPLSKMTGGLIPECHDNEFARAMEVHATAPAGMAPGATPMPPPPPPPAVAAAAKIKEEQAQAAIRRQAVQYLAGLDCRYYPEAEQALIASLRADRDECVRLEAARAFLKCGCCTPAVMKALSISAAGTDADGNPCEKSPRVRMTALTALNNCQCNIESVDTTLPRPEMPIGVRPASDDIIRASYNAPIASPSTSSPPASNETSPAATPSNTGQSLLEIWQRSTR